MTAPIFLAYGSHTSREDGMCVMEMAAWLAGEPHTAAPACVAVSICRLAIAYNDRASDEDRQKLLPYLPRMLGTAGDGREPERLQVLRAWLIRTALPDWLELAGRTGIARRFRGLPDEAVEQDTLRLVREARGEARDALLAARARLREKVKGAVNAGYDHASAASTAATHAADHAADPAAASASADASSAAAAAASTAATNAAAYASAAAADTAAYASAAAADTAAASADVYDAVYEAVRPLVDAKLSPIAGRHNADFLRLLDEMLPATVVQTPVVEDWESITGYAGSRS